MRLFQVLAIAMLVGAIPPSAAAQSEPPASTDAPAVTAERIIASAGAEGHFRAEPSDDPGYVQARSTRSGLRCRFDVRSGGRITVFPPRPGVTAPGDDVGCNTPSGESQITFYATRYDTPTTTSAQIEEAVAAIRARFDVRKELAAKTPEGPDGPGVRTFLIHEENGMTATRVAVAIVDGWVFKLRFTGPESALPAADALWAEALADFRGADRAPRPGI